MGLTISGNYSRLGGWRASPHSTVNIWSPSELGSYLNGSTINARIWGSGDPAAPVRLTYTMDDAGNLPAGFTVSNDSSADDYGFIKGTLGTVTQNTTYSFTVRVTQDLTPYGGQVLTNTKKFFIYQNIDNVVYYWTFNKALSSTDATPNIGTLAGGGPISSSSPTKYSSSGGSSVHFLSTNAGANFGAPTWGVSTTMDFINNSDFTFETYFLGNQGYWPSAYNRDATLFSINGEQFAVKFAKSTSETLPSGANQWSAFGHCYTSIDPTHNFGGVGLKTVMWNHIAVVRHNNKLKIYLNGKSNGTELDLAGKTLVSHTGNYSQYSRFVIGGNYDEKSYYLTDNQMDGGFGGFFANFKLSNKANYTKDFTATWGRQMPASWGSQANPADASNWNGWQFSDWSV